MDGFSAVYLTVGRTLLKRPTPLPSLSCCKTCTTSVRTRLILQENGKSSAEPVVPSGAIEAIVRSCYSAEASFGPVEARNSLLHIYEELRELYLAGVDGGVNSPHDAVRLLLDTAGDHSEATPSNSAQNSEMVGFQSSFMHTLAEL